MVSSEVTGFRTKYRLVLKCHVLKLLFSWTVSYPSLTGNLRYVQYSSCICSQSFDVLDFEKINIHKVYITHIWRIPPTSVKMYVSCIFMQALTDQVKHLTKLLENKLIIIQKLQDDNEVFFRNQQRPFHNDKYFLF